MGSYTKQADATVAQGVPGAYSKKKEQFQALEGGIKGAQGAAMQALQNQRGVVNQMPGALDAARSDAMRSIRQGSAQAIGAAGAQANQGAGGLANLTQAGMTGGIQMAKTGSELAASNLEAMQMAGQRLGSMAGDMQGLVTSGYDAIQDAGGSLEAMRGSALAEAKANMAKIFKDYEGAYNTDAEEAAYAAAMQAEIDSADDPVIRDALIKLKAAYDKDFESTIDWSWS